MTLREVSPDLLAQVVPGQTTRWFRADASDLFVWQRPDGALTGFHYTLRGEILVWADDTGFTTGVVDDGEVGRERAHKMTPIIQRDPRLVPERRQRLASALGAELVGLDTALAARLAAVLAAVADSLAAGHRGPGRDGLAGGD